MGKKKSESSSAGAPKPLNAAFASLKGAFANVDLPAAPIVTAPLEGKVIKPASEWPDKVVLRRERKGRGGKTVTVIAGVPAAKRELVTKTLKTGLGCGASEEGDDIVLLGDVLGRAADWLRKAGARVVEGN